MFPCHRSNS
jgi:hypothetical protein